MRFDKGVILRLLLSAAAGISLTMPVVLAQPAPETVYAWYKGDEGLGLLADQYTIGRWTNRATQVVPDISVSARNLGRVTGSPFKVYLRKKDGSTAGAVAFNGNDGLWSAKTEFGVIATNRTMVLYARLRDNVSQGFLFDATSFSPGLMRAQVKTGYWHVGASGSASSSYASTLGTATSPAVTNIWQVHTFVVSTNNGLPRYEHFINSVLAAGVSISTNGALSGLMIGANVAQQFGIRAEVAEVLVFDRALDPTSRMVVESYLSNKWDGVIADPDAPKPPAAVTRVPVFENGKEGYGCYRIPAMVTTLRGTLIAMADGRINGCGDIPNPLDLVAKRSYDNGRTWTPLQVIVNYGSDPTDTDVYPHYGITNPIPRVCGGDAALLLDRTNGRVWVLYDNGGNSGGRKIKLEMRFSDDNGTNWSGALDIEAINPGLRPSSSGEFLTGPGNGIQLTSGTKAGRLIFPVYLYGSPSSSMVIYSDDHGQTWQRGGVAGAGGGEIQVAETSNGVLLASMRDNNFSTSGVRTFSRSVDGGITWGTPYTNTPNQPALPDPACQASIIRLTTTNQSNANRLVHANAADSSSRIKMTLRMSYDEGQTWPVTDLIYAGSSAYSALAPLTSGEVGLLFEADGYTRIDFVRRSVEEMTNGADSLPPYTSWSGDWFSPEELSDPTISGPDADPDGDSSSNYHESIAGTDPLDSRSYLALNVPKSVNQPVLSFAGQSNRNYTLEYREAVGLANWQAYLQIPARATSFLAQVPVVFSNDSGFFRLAIPQLDD